MRGQRVIQELGDILFRKVGFEYPLRRSADPLVEGFQERDVGSYGQHETDAIRKRRRQEREVSAQVSELVKPVDNTIDPAVRQGLCGLREAVNKPGRKRFQTIRNEVRLAQRRQSETSPEHRRLRQQRAH